MTRLGDIVEKVRSKNAGPFWMTVDIFCGTPAAFARVTDLPTQHVASLFQTDPALIRRFDIADLNVVKFSFPRPQVQGSIHDRDMHGAALGALLAELELNP
ncbi:MAG: DUF4387 family protein [Paracoccaceae bacterium]